MNRILLSCLVLFVTACSAPQVRMDIAGSPNLNIDEKNQPLPVVIRVYQLTATNRFVNSTFEDLWKRDLSALGNTLLSRKEVVVVPGKYIRIEFRKHEKARFVAVMAIFRQPGEKGWRAWKDISNGYITKSMSSSYRISITGNRVYLD